MTHQYSHHVPFVMYTLYHKNMPSGNTMPPILSTLALKLKHNRCYEALVQETGVIHTTKMITCDHHDLSIQPISNVDWFLKATLHLQHIIDQSQPSAPPDELVAYDNLHQLFLCHPDALFTTMEPKNSTVTKSQNPITSPYVHATCHSTWWWLIHSQFFCNST